MTIKKAYNETKLVNHREGIFQSIAGTGFALLCVLFGFLEVFQRHFFSFLNAKDDE
jgi:hypothetical protein